jgi:hypothetical protein
MSYLYPHQYPYPAQPLPDAVLLLQVLLWVQFGFSLVQWGMVIMTGYAVSMGISHTGDESGFAKVFISVWLGVFMLMTAALPQLALLAPTISSCMIVPQCPPRRRAAKPGPTHRGWRLVPRGPTASRGACEASSGAVTPPEGTAFP